MGNDGYTHVSHKIGPEVIGLDWLTGITEWMTPMATHVQPHMHSHIELIFCLKGAMTYKVSGHGNVTIHEGSGIVMPANTVHVLEGGTDAPCRRLGLHISRSMSYKRRYAVFSPADLKAFHATLSKMAARPFRLDAKLQYIKENASAPFMKRALREAGYRYLIAGKRNTLRYVPILWLLKRKLYRMILVKQS